MKRSEIPAIFIGSLLLILAAFFTDSILVQFFGLGINPHTFVIFHIGEILSVVYGFSSILIPIFLFISAIVFFLPNFNEKKAVILGSSLFPFFTCVVTEKILQKILPNSTEPVFILKICAGILLSTLLIAIEYLCIIIIFDSVKNIKLKKNKAENNKILEPNNSLQTEQPLETKNSEKEEITEVEKSSETEKNDELQNSIPTKKNTEQPTGEDPKIFSESKAEIIKNPQSIFDIQDNKNPTTPFASALEKIKEVEEKSEYPVSNIDEKKIETKTNYDSGSDPIRVTFSKEEFEALTEGLESDISMENESESKFLENPFAEDDEDKDKDFEQKSESQSFMPSSTSFIPTSKSTSSGSTSENFEKIEQKNSTLEPRPLKYDKHLGEENFINSDETEQKKMNEEIPLMKVQLGENEDEDENEENEFTTNFDEDSDNFDLKSDEDSTPTNTIMDPLFVCDNVEESLEKKDSDNENTEKKTENTEDKEFFFENDDDYDDIDESFDSSDSFEKKQSFLEDETEYDCTQSDCTQNKAGSVNSIPNSANSISKSWRGKNYFVPSDKLLTEYPNGEYWIIDEETKKQSLKLKEILSQFKIDAEVTGIKKGPVITMFELVPAPGVKLSKIVALSDNIALGLAASSVRIVAPIPGKSAVGIEIPNKERAIVSFKELIDTESSAFKKMSIPVVLGKDITGGAQLLDIAKTPHLLIAGSTGSGKSVCVNSLILSILYKRSPQEVKLILIDPKVVELKLYNDIPHLLTPVITEPKRAFQSLQYCLCEMERRYACLDGMGVRDISSYNRRIIERNIATEKLPHIVVVIDEFADLMATTGKELESTIARLAAMSRAVGIHLVLATQRPSIDVITGLIKANIPSRIAFMVASKMDSRIIIDQVGADKLLGKGDMLYVNSTDPFPIRIQGTYVSDNDVENVVEYVKQYGEPEYIDEEIFVDDDDDFENSDSLFTAEGEDPLYNQALEIVIQSGKASASYLQRRLKIGYNRAARLIEDMEQRGIVGPANGSKAREIIHIP
ncbi:MAG: DNA translocase FtsK [Treponemataceae bacterium]